MKKLLFSAAVAAFMIGCTSPEQNSETTTAQQETETVEQNTAACPLDYVAGSMKLEWTAYKTSEKIGVNGTFDDIIVEGTNDNMDAISVFQTAKVIIPVSSLNSNNEIRDPKIKESFFGTIGATELAGKVRAITPATDNSGDITLSIIMGQVDHQITGKYVVENDIVSAEFDLNVADWNAEAGIAELNKVCEDLHKGADGKSMLWPDVKLTIKAKVAKKC